MSEDKKRKKRHSTAFTIKETLAEITMRCYCALTWGLRQNLGGKLDGMRRNRLAAGESKHRCGRSADSPATSSEAEHAATKQASNCTLVLSSQSSEGVCSHKNLPVHVHGSLIRNRPKADKT